MTPNQTMHSIQRFTNDGKIGVAMLLTSPFISGGCYAWLLHEIAKVNSYNQNLFAPAILLVLSGLAFLGGAVAVLIGREQITTVTSIEPQQPRQMNYIEAAISRAGEA